jgi:hypothetical protein
MNRQFVIAIALIVAIAGCSKNELGSDWVGGFQDVAKLATLEVQLNKIVYATKSKKFLFVNLGTASHVAATKAIVKIGVDLNEIRSEHVKINGDLIELVLPPIKILDFIYQPSEFKVRKELTSNQAFSKIKVSDLEEAYRAAETELRKSLRYIGLKELGEKRNRMYFRSFLHRFGFKNIIITFQESEKPIDQF